jgi:hypothetical protein
MFKLGKAKTLKSARPEPAEGKFEIPSAPSDLNPWQKKSSLRLSQCLGVSVVAF